MLGKVFSHSYSYSTVAVVAVPVTPVTQLGFDGFGDRQAVVHQCCRAETLHGSHMMHLQ